MSWDEQQVKQLREQLKLGVGEFARLAGVDPRTVYRWEAGEAKPSGASEAVLNGLREKLRKDPDQTDSISGFLIGAAAIGGLGYLIVKLLDSINDDKNPGGVDDLLWPGHSQKKGGDRS